MIKQQDPRSTDPTITFRKQAVWLFPSAFLIHSLFVYGAYRPLVRPSLFAALVSTAIGLGIRWVRNLRAVQALAMFLIAFLMLYTMGVVAPTALLVVVDQRDAIGLVSSLSIFAIVVLVAGRTWASLRREWSLPLEESPNVVLYPHDNTLVRVAVNNPSRFLPVAAATMLVVLIVLLLATRGTSWYSFVALGIAPAFLAVLGSDVVARMLAFLIVTRRWELKHHAKLKVPPLR